MFSPAMTAQFEKLHFILFPLMAQGHMIPIIDIAKLLAQRGATVTVITTPVNITRYKPAISRALELGLNIRLHELQFPCTEAGLPEGCENSDMLPSLCLSLKFIASMAILQPQFERFMEEVEPRPSCIISDMSTAYTSEVARKFGIPRIAFHGPGCFYLLCSYYIFIYNIPESVTSDSEPFSIPGLPDQIKFTQKELDTMGNNSKEWKDAFRKYLDSEKGVCGIIVNTFEELEADYVEAYKKLKPNKVWCIGPVSLCNKHNLEKAQRGNKTAIDENECLKWLDALNPSSAIYACLGSLNNLKPAHMMELGLGLESSNKPFIWVIRENEDSIELKKLILENGFEERVKGRGLLIWGWAPQVLILSHPSIGAFLTHCGWNSALEGVAAGVPLITWPLFGDQFYNERLVVEVLGIGVRVGVEVSTVRLGKEENIGVSVKREMVEQAIDKVMDRGEEGERRREKARDLGEMAKTATENGGSSHQNITSFIEDIRQHLTTSL